MYKIMYTELKLSRVVALLWKLVTWYSHVTQLSDGNSTLDPDNFSPDPARLYRGDPRYLVTSSTALNNFPTGGKEFTIRV